MPINGNHSKVEVNMAKLVSIEETAQQLGITVAAVRDWRFRRKHLDFVKVGRAVRVLQSSIDKFIETQTVPARRTPETRF